MRFLQRYRRAKRFKKIRAEKIARISEAKKYLSKWDDIPMTWLFTSLCDILKIKPNEAAWRLCYDILLSDIISNETDEELSRRLP